MRYRYVGLWRGFPGGAVLFRADYDPETIRTIGSETGQHPTTWNRNCHGEFGKTESKVKSLGCDRFGIPTFAKNRRMWATCEWLGDLEVTLGWLSLTGIPRRASGMTA
jgi:hypothetical protein